MMRVERKKESLPQFVPGGVYLIRQGRRKYRALLLGAKDGTYRILVGENSLDTDFPAYMDGVKMAVSSPHEYVGASRIREYARLTGDVKSRVHERFLLFVPCEKKRVSVRLSAEDVEKAKAMAQKRGLGWQTFIALTLHRALAD